MLVALTVSREIRWLNGMMIRRFKEALETLVANSVKVNGQILESPP